MARHRPRQDPRPSTATPAIDEATQQRAAQLVDEVRSRLRSAGKPQAAAQLRREHGEATPCYGVPLQQANRFGQDLMRHVRGAGLPLAMAIADPLFLSGNIEEGIVADVVVTAQARHIGAGEFERFAAWVGCLTNAPNTDDVSAHMISRSLSGKPSLVATLAEWARSGGRWQRRAAVMAFTPRVREGRFLTDALEVAELLMEDEDAAVQEGVGTLLMEATRLKADRVVEFLMPWKDRSPETIVRLAATKLPPEHRMAVLGR